MAEIPARLNQLLAKANAAPLSDQSAEHFTERNFLMDRAKTPSFRAIVVLQCIIALWMIRMLVLSINTGDMNIDHVESLGHAVWIATATVGIPLLISIVCVLSLYRRKRYAVPLTIGFDTLLTILLGFALASDVRLLGESLPATGYHAASADLMEHLLVFGCSMCALSFLIHYHASGRATVAAKHPNR